MKISEKSLELFKNVFNAIQ